jgi:hypothetical protein
MLHPEERETIIRTSDADHVWFIWTAKGSQLSRKLKRIAEPEHEDEHGYRFVLPLSMVLVRAEPKKREVNEERKAALKDTLSRARESKGAVKSL